MRDRFGRTIEYLRVSITDRCDLRCKYCMPNGCEKVSMDQILTYEEIVRICRAASSLGISKIKITGGEPFVRLGCTDLIRDIKALDGIDEVTVTTNGQTLCRYINELKDIGIDGINISLDTLDSEKFKYITGCGDLDKTLQAIDASVDAGIRTKINCVPQRGFNDNELICFADMAFEKGIDVRFIEIMPIGAGDSKKGISNEETQSLMLERWPYLQPDNSVHGNGPAVYLKRPGKEGCIGFISALHGVFCNSCNRIRLTSQGQIKPCLCYGETVDLMPYLRCDGIDDQLLTEKIRDAIILKPESHCFNIIKSEEKRRMENSLMSQIGG